MQADQGLLARSDQRSLVALHAEHLESANGERPPWLQHGADGRPNRARRGDRARAAGDQDFGSGQGSISTRDILAELPALAEHITNGIFNVGAQPMPLADVEQAWAESADTDRRVVLVPKP